MDLRPSASDRRTGFAAVAAGVLLFLSVAAELVHPVQASDGTVLELGLLVAYIAAWVLGAGSLLVGVLGIGRPGPDGTSTLRRGGRIGRRASITGAGLLLAFGVVFLVGLLVTGKPVEASFVLFGLGLLALAAGQIMLGFGLRRSDALGPWWLALVVAGVGALVAVLVFTAPWHDLGLLTFDAAWVALGARLLRGTKPVGARLVSGRRKVRSV
jgi:hypothetical protein